MTHQGGSRFEYIFVTIILSNSLTEFHLILDKGISSLNPIIFGVQTRLCIQPFSSPNGEVKYSIFKQFLKFFHTRLWFCIFLAKCIFSSLNSATRFSMLISQVFCVILPLYLPFRSNIFILAFSISCFTCFLIWFFSTSLLFSNYNTSFLRLV